LSVTLRTIDLGGDALKGASQGTAVPNPALGLRATRLALQRPEMLGPQLRAALRAAALGPMRIMFPLIAGIEELRLARAALEAARAELQLRGVAAGEVRVGVMIELPSAVMMADRFTAECDFLSVGTNDLVQYGLGVDRSNPAVAYLAQAADPAVLRMLAMIQRSSELAREPTSMCGDMAADPLLLPLVIGLGFRHLSVPVSAVPLVREVISRVDSTQAADVALRALASATAAEVRALVEAEFGSVLADVWTETGASSR
jgi:phosphotransferase system enzyme I (PtsI)